MELLTAQVSEIAVRYYNKQKASERPKVTTSSDAYHVLFKKFNPDTVHYQEEFLAMYLNRANHVLGISRVGLGGNSSVTADPKIVVAVALKIAASGIIISHNHPSGSLSPSNYDKDLTQKIHQGAKFLDLKLLDHLIVSPHLGEYYSFADEGLI
jgi:DNA repair protein RadC